MKVLLSLTLCASYLYGQAADTEARAVLGFQQAGASAAKPKQKFFFDFFIDRKLASFRWSLWGDVRVASTPRQISAPIGQLGITRDLIQLPVNELAETVEFSSGLDYHPWSWKLAGDATRRLGFIAYAGASAPPECPHFYRSWGGGIRLTTEYPGGAPPAATYTISAGQDEAVTGGRLHGPVGKIDVFYPLPLTLRQFRWVYLFGDASLRLAGVAKPDDRDAYRIGVGVDAVALVCALGGTLCK